MRGRLSPVTPETTKIQTGGGSRPTTNGMEDHLVLNLAELRVMDEDNGALQAVHHALLKSRVPLA